jgi:hypothetical protein
MDACAPRLMPDVRRLNDQTTRLKHMVHGMSAALVVLFAASVAAQERHAVAPPKSIPQKVGGFEVVSGDPDKVGMPYVIRISNDAGYVVLPHTHPEDENIVVVRGSWTVTMDNRVDRSALRSMEVGAYTFVPTAMAHFGWGKTATTIQVHGIGPFSTDFVDPAYELADTGVSLIRTAGRPGERVRSIPGDCFALQLGNRVRSARGEGRVVGALCSPANRFMQYWVGHLI